MSQDCSACEQYQLFNIADNCPLHSDDYEGSQADFVLMEADEMDARAMDQYERSLENLQERDLVY